MKKLILNISGEDYVKFEAECEKHKLAGHELVAHFIKDAGNCSESNEPQLIIQSMAYFVKVRNKIHQLEHIAKFSKFFVTEEPKEEPKEHYILNISISNEDYEKFENMCATEKVNAISVIENFIQDVGYGSKQNDADIYSSARVYFDMVWYKFHPETNEFYRDMNGGLHRKDEVAFK